MFGSALPLSLDEQQPLGSMPQAPAPDLPQVGQYKKQGMFAEGGVGRAIAGMIGDYLLQRAGMQPIYQPTMMEKQKLALEEQQYQRQRQDKRDDFVFEQEHRAPPNNDTAADYSFWQQHLSPEDFEAWKQNKINPPQYMNVPGVGLVQIPRGGADPQGVPTAPVGKLTPLGAGGPSPSGSAGFR